MKKSLPNLVVGVLLGLFIAWLAGLFNPIQPPASSPAANSTANSTPADIKLTAPAPAQVKQVAAPTAAPAIPAATPLTAARAKVAATSPQGVATNTAAQQAMAQAAIDKVRQQSRVKAMTNNLRQLSSATQQYMLDHGVTAASYYDLVGTGTDSYIRNVAPVMGEDYSSFYMTQRDTQVMVVAPDGTIVTYDQ